MFILVEIVGDILISWLPLYYEAKLGFLVWLTFFKGATVIYDRLVHKYVVARAASVILCECLRARTTVRLMPTHRIPTHRVQVH